MARATHTLPHLRVVESVPSYHCRTRSRLLSQLSKATNPAVIRLPHAECVRRVKAKARITQ